MAPSADSTKAVASTSTQASTSTPAPAPLASITVQAPVNIAVVKYWGKRDTDRYLPTNSSLSGTLDMARLASTTTIHLFPPATAADAGADDRFELDGAAHAVTPRMARVIAEVRQAAAAHYGAHSAQATGRLAIHSANNFPTAAGLASSASGYAALAYALCHLLGLEMSPSEISAIARLGSGSACRSLFGGWVRWAMGDPALDHTVEGPRQSIASPVVDAAHWPQVQALICVVSAGMKSVASTRGMQQTVATSALFAERVRQVPDTMHAMETALVARDFEAFAQLTMRESNQFHATCLDTQPPIHYLVDTSFRIIDFVHAFNAHAGEAVVAYTFDAGPNAVLYFRDAWGPPLLQALAALFLVPTAGAEVAAAAARTPGTTPRPRLTDAELAPLIIPPAAPLGIASVMHACIGEGPRIVSRTLPYLSATCA